MPEHRDMPASDLARGPAKPSDIERARRDVDQADAQSVRAEEVSVARHRQRVFQSGGGERGGGST
jgi:hypothetical protein